MRYGVFLFVLFFLFAGAGAQEHRRLIVTAGDASPLPMDPLTGRYRAGSMAAVAAFEEQWRAELGEANVAVIDLPVRPRLLGDRIYSLLGDSTLALRAMREVGYVSAAAVDSVLNGFGLTRAAADSLAVGEWLVADCYRVAGNTAVSIKRQDFKDIRPSKTYEERMAEDEKRMRRFFLMPVAELDTAVSTRPGFFGPSAMADLFHRFQLEASGAEVSFFAPPVMDASLPKGPICLGDVIGLFRFENQLVTVRMTGRELLAFMEKVFGMRFFRIEGPESDMVRLRVPYYLHDDVAGIRFRVDLTARNGHRVTVYETERGAKFDQNGIYTVALNSFRARDFVEMGLRPVVVAEDYRLALARWLTAHPKLSPRARDNWSAGPERWVRAIRVREERTIFEAR